ncbi:MAG: type II secretion system protein [Verrucomicrobiia bacterium]
MKTPVPSQGAEREIAMENNPKSRIQNLKSPEAGFTLLEILVASGVLALMVTILFALFAEGSNAWRMGERTAEINQTVRTAMDLIIRDVSLAIVDTNQPSTTVQPIQGLSVVISKTSAGESPASDPTPYGVYEELRFVTPVAIGNEITNNITRASAYRALCGVRYYVTKAVDDSGKESVLGNLTRVVYRPITRGDPTSFYNDPWAAGHLTNSAVIAENVLCFRVHPAQKDTAAGLKPRNSQMFKDMDADQDLTINNNNFINSRDPCYPGVYIGLSVVDSRQAVRINQTGLSGAAKSSQFYAATNWTLVHFENFKP